VPPELFDAVCALVPPEDREPEAPLFGWVDQGRLRMVMARACRAAGVPLLAARPPPSAHVIADGELARSALLVRAPVRAPGPDV
jgi:hypothetical protein